MLCSSGDILQFNCVLNVLLQSFGQKMARIDATMAIDRIEIAAIQNGT